MTQGIHHITAISSNTQKTYDFYTGILGLRLVKKTVNFDAPDVYHLYFGNEKGDPGTILTFFPFPEAGTGLRGLGQVTKIYFSVAKESLGYWTSRFVEKGVRHNVIKKRFSESYVTFFDPDGLQLELVGTAETDTFSNPWQVSDISEGNYIRGFFGAELSVSSTESMSDVFQLLGYIKKEKQDFLVRFENKEAATAKYLDLFIMKGWPDAITSAGTNHHIAFRVANQSQQVSVREQLVKKGFRPTEVIDRNYFTSVYFRENNGILFEIATDTPGFTVDEDSSELGMNLKLPAQFEEQRSYIESVLPPLMTSAQGKKQKDSDIDLFQYKFVNRNSAQTYVLFHGTGGNETEMIKFSDALKIKDNVLSVRGNIKEDGMNRFFKRHSNGTFDIDSIKAEISKFTKFLKAICLKLQLEEQPLIFLGYSNGANFALAYALSYPTNITKMYALHPMAPFEKSEVDLSKTEIIVTYGKNDIYSTTNQIEMLKKLLNEVHANAIYTEFESGHQIGKEEIAFLQSQINKK